MKNFLETFVIRNDAGKLNWVLSFMVVVYIATITLTYGSFSALPKLAGIIIIPVALIVFLIRGDVAGIKRYWKVTVVIAGYLLIMLAFSLYIWVTGLEAARYILRGSEKIVYQLINLAVVLSATYLFGEKNVKITFYSVCLVEFFYIIRAYNMCGFNATIDSIVYFFTNSFEQKGFMNFIEINDVTYVFGFFAVYFLFMSRDSRTSRFWHAFVSLFFLFSGYKRIGTLAIAVVVILGLALYKLPPKKRNAWIMGFAISIAIIAFAYVPIVRYGLLEKLMVQFNINMNTRDKIYAYIAQIYDFTPSFKGYGFDYVVRFIADLSEAGTGMDGVGVKKLHSDLLVQYIELGFFGYMFFLYYNCIFLQQWWRKHYGDRIAFMYMLLNIYNFITYTTDNTAYSYQVTFTMRIVMIGGLVLALREAQKEKSQAPPDKLTITNPNSILEALPHK